MEQRRYLRFNATPEQDMSAIVYAKAQSWQEALSEVKDTNRLLYLGQQAVEELDSIFPHLGKTVYMSGNGLHIAKDPETQEFLGEVWQYSPGCLGVHNGFELITDKSNKDYRLMQQIVVGRKKSMVEKTILQDLVAFEYFDLESSCLLVNELDEIFYEDDDTIDFNEQLDILFQSSSALRSLLQSARFQRQTRENQQKQVDNIMLITEKNTKLRGSQMLIKAENAYVNIFNEHSNFYPMNILGFQIGGMCLGVEPIVSLKLNEQAIRRNSDLSTNDSDICIMLAPNKETQKTLKMNPKQLLYLPINQDVEFEKIIN